VAYSPPMTMERPGKMISTFSKKLENYAAAEANRLSKSNHGKLRLIGFGIGAARPATKSSIATKSVGCRGSRTEAGAPTAMPINSLSR
jgi:hypothetical protein